MKEKELELHKLESTIEVSVSSIPEFEELLLQAESEAAQLHKTLQKLRRFTINFNFSQK